MRSMQPALSNDDQALEEAHYHIRRYYEPDFRSENIPIPEMPVSPSSSVVNLEGEDSQDQELPETLASPVRQSSSNPSPSGFPVMKRARPSLPVRRPATLMGFSKPTQNSTKAAALASADSRIFSKTNNYKISCLIIRFRRCEDLGEPLSRNL
jgi:hypothetical protein